MVHPARIGKYEIETFLGGSMAQVYRARDAILGRPVAVKILAARNDAEAKARFFQEARVASNLAHENVIAVYDYGEEQGLPFMVMEFLEGESLREILRDGRAGDFTQRIRIALQLARALEYIHSKKIVHRDIKPENIHVEATGRVKLMDFGIAKPEDVNLTRTGLTVGTPFYMAPEQVLGKPVTAQTDVYAFGLLLYELLSGERAIRGRSFDEVFEEILNHPLRLDPLLDAGVPPLLIATIGRCAAKNAAERPLGLGAVCGQLESLLDPAQRPMSRSPEMAAFSSLAITPAVRSRDSGRPARSFQAYEDLPAVLRALPAPLKTPMGLMILSGAGVLALALLGLKLARAI